MIDRIDKVNELIRQQLGFIIAKELELPVGAILTITRVSISKDLSIANVFVSIVPADKVYETMKILIDNAKQLPGMLNEKIVLRRIPRLRFRMDEAEQKAVELDEILDSLDIKER